MTEKKGSCLCGAVSFTIEGDFEHAPEACHCSMCRKHSGHYLAAVNVRKSRLHLTGEADVGWFQSSDKVARGFCKQCGSTLFWKPNLDGYEWIAVALGLFDEPTGLQIAKHTFVKDKGDYYEIPEGAEQSDEF